MNLNLLQFYQQMKHNLSHGQFVLVKNNSQQKLTWKGKWNRQQKKHIGTSNGKKPHMIYGQKKSIVKNLYSGNSQSQNFKLRHFKTTTPQTRISTGIPQRTSLIPNYIYSNTVRAQTADLKSTLSGKSRFNHRPFFISQSLIEKVTIAKQSKNRVIAVIKVNRLGLRYKIKYCHLQLSNSHEQFLKNIQKQFKQFKILKKIPYFFHLGGEPINNIVNQIKNREYVIMVDMSPKLNLDFNPKMQIFDQATKLEEQIRICERNCSIGDEIKSQQSLDNMQNQDYEWIKIKNVKQYVDQIVQNPEKLKKKKIKKILDDQLNLKKWLGEKFEQPKIQKQNNKNPLFQTVSHYPGQIFQADMLILANHQLQRFKTINNIHKYKQTPEDIEKEKRKRQKQIENKQQPKKDTYRTRQLPKSSKQSLRRLDLKNTVLSSQNIPYIMEKYGIVRSEAHNLYALYKTLEKVSAMRMGPIKYEEVYSRGIDRQTFDQGMKGLEINPGDEVIRNICAFPDYISWQQFLKIVSISLRKTPEEKLQAILQGIGGTSDGYLSEIHIDILVGSSLKKIFNQDEPELKKYFVSVVMKELDPNLTGKIQIQYLKDRVLKRPADNMNIVSFLMLNS